MDMNANEAREHLEMVDRILAKADREPIQLVPGLIIVWGIAAALIDAGQQMYVSHTGGKLGIWVSDAALLLGIVYSVVISVALMRNHAYDRVSLLEKRMGRTMGAVWFTVIIAAFAQPHVFAGWGGAAVWSMGSAIMMLTAGFNGDRRGLIGGLVLLASVLVANYLTPQMPGYALAAGFILGYAIPGVLFLVQGPCGDA